MYTCIKHPLHRLAYIFDYNDPHPSLVLVQPRKTRPCITEKLLMGRKE